MSLGSFFVLFLVIGFSVVKKLSKGEPIDMNFIVTCIIMVAFSIGFSYAISS